MNFDDVPKPFVFMDEVLFESQFIKISISKNIKKYYSDLFQTTLEIGELVDVPIGWLRGSSNTPVSVVCPSCKNVKTKTLSSLRKAGHGFCLSCKSQKTYGHMVGNKFGRLLVLKINDERRLSGQVMVATCSCLCECGTHFDACCVDLLKGNTQSCGCLQKDSMRGKTLTSKFWTEEPGLPEKVYERGSVFDELIGKKFGRGTVLYYGEDRERPNGLVPFPTFVLKCECGNYYESVCHAVKSGNTTSCGCTKRNDSLTDEERANKRATFEYKQWRKAVFERDSYTCKSCGMVGGKLIAHHIVSYHSNKKLRLDVDNGITLCKKCHKEFHIDFMGGYRIKCNSRDLFSFLKLKKVETQ